MADEALFLLLHNEMVSGVYKSAEQGEVVSAATYPGVLLDAPRDPAGHTLGSCWTHPGILRDAPWGPPGRTLESCGMHPGFLQDAPEALRDSSVLLPSRGRRCLLG